MRHKRVSYSNAIYHIYNQGVNRDNLFLDTEDNEYWLSLLHSTIKKYSIEIFSFVTMQNHYHCLLRTIDPNISDVMWYIGYFFAIFINKKYKRVGPLFRNRFQSQLIENNKYFKNVVSYIHNNPLEAGLIKDVYEKYPSILTSFHTLVGKTKEYPWLAKTELYKLLDIPIAKNNNQNYFWNPIKNETFSNLTRIETMNQKIKHSSK